MPTHGHGKICYVEIPATDVARSAAFYESALGWKTRKRSNGSTAFDDGVGEVSGTWVTGRPPMSEVGMLIYVMVDNIRDAIRSVEAAGGVITQPLGVDAPELTARFRDPAGNIIGLYQNP
jgi:predicted enzyme related to lactoylglutathione lyase